MNQAIGTKLGKNLHDASDPNKSLIVEFKELEFTDKSGEKRKTKKFDVTMAGYWDGSLLKSAIRAIELKYADVRRHSAVSAMKHVQEQSKEKK